MSLDLKVEIMRKDMGPCGKGDSLIENKPSSTPFVSSHFHPSGSSIEHLQGDLSMHGVRRGFLQLRFAGFSFAHSFHLSVRRMRSRILSTVSTQGALPVAQWRETLLLRILREILRLFMAIEVGGFILSNKQRSLF